MLVEFKVSNFRSFKGDTTFSMVASSIKEHRDEDYLYEVNDKLSLLKVSVIYGANASGKSNLFKAMLFMKDFVLHSVEKRLVGYYHHHILQPFRLSVGGEKRPAFFEVIFYISDTFYRYGFGVDSKKVVSEWLFVRPNVPHKKEICYFYRELDNFEVLNKKYFKESVDIVKKGKVRSDALLLTTAANFNGEVSLKVFSAFESFYFLHRTFPFPLTFMEIEKNGTADVLSFLRMADLGIDDIRVQVVPWEKIPEEVKKSVGITEKTLTGRIVRISHKVYNESGQALGEVWFDLGVDESEGTRLFFEMIGGVIVSLRRGAILFVDEIDSSLHPLLVKKICEIFLSKRFNPKGAQLIFTTHDVSLLRDSFLRRDQVWFVEKDNFGISHLYSLLEFKKNGKKVRKDESYEKGYLLGRYGAVPVLSEPKVSYDKEE